MLSIFLTLSLSEFVEVTLAGLATTFEHPQAVVLFYGEDKIDSILSTLNSASQPYKYFSFVKVNLSGVKETPPFPIKTLPSVVFVYKGKYVGTLNDKIETETVRSCLSRLETSILSRPYQLTNPLEAIQATKNSTSSVIIFSKEDSFIRRFRMIPEYDVTIPIYVVSNAETAASVGLEKLNSILITRAIDGKSKIFSQKELYDESSNTIVQNFVRPFITVCHYDEQIGNGLDGFTIAALVEEGNPLQRNEVSDNFKQLYGTFKRTINYHIGYYGDLDAPIKQYNIDNYSIPTYILYYKYKGEKTPILYSCYERSPGMIRKWVKYTMSRLPEDIEKYKYRNQIDWIGGAGYADLIIGKAADNFILLSDWSFDNYENVFDIYMKLLEIFIEHKDLKFHFYDPLVRPRAHMPAIEPEISTSTLRFYKSGRESKPVDIKLNKDFETILRQVLRLLDKSISSKEVRKNIEKYIDPMKNRAM